MSEQVYSEDQRDALQEIVNVAMGQAADSLARVLDRFIQLPVPRIRVVEADKVVNEIRELCSDLELVTGVRQAFSSHAQGEAIVIFSANSGPELADIMGYDSADDPAVEDELLLDVSNILVGACLGGIATQLGHDLSYSPPSIIVRKQPIDQLFGQKKVPWSTALFVEVNFKIENKNFVSHVFVFWPELALDALREAIDKFLENMT